MLDTDCLTVCNYKFSNNFVIMNLKTLCWYFKVSRHVCVSCCGGGCGGGGGVRGAACMTGSRVLWCGVVWRGAVWCGIVWCGVVNVVVACVGEVCLRCGLGGNATPHLPSNL